MKQLSTLFAIAITAIVASACNGQNNLQQKSDASLERVGNPKLIKNHFTDEQTLLYWGVNDGLQARNGDLWFITGGEGVYRYDGKLFTTYTKKDGLSSNTVCSILEDRDGNIWFGTRDGASRFDGELFTTFRILETDREPDFPERNTFPRKNQVWSMLQDKSGMMLFGTSEGVYRYDGKTFTTFLDGVVHDTAIHLRMVHCMHQDTAGNIWFGSGFTEDEGACRFDGRSITSVKPNGDGWVRRIVEDKKGTLFFATRHKGVCRYDEKGFTNITAQAGIKDDDVSTITFDKSGNLWIATESGSGYLDEKGGLWRYDGTSFTHFTTADGLPHNGVFSVTEDRSGNLWIGTRNTGLSRYDGKTFTTFSE